MVSPAEAFEPSAGPFAVCFKEALRKEAMAQRVEREEEGLQSSDLDSVRK